MDEGLPPGDLKLPPERPHMLHDQLGVEKRVWTGEQNRIDLDPRVMPTRIMRLHLRMRREQDFDFFM
jgi:starch synthase (maltosyl-transferring)